MNSHNKCCINGRTKFRECDDLSIEDKLLLEHLVKVLFNNEICLRGCEVHEKYNKNIQEEDVKLQSTDIKHGSGVVGGKYVFSKEYNSSLTADSHVENLTCKEDCATRFHPYQCYGASHTKQYTRKNKVSGNQINVKCSEHKSDLENTKTSPLKEEITTKSQIAPINDPSSLFYIGPRHPCVQKYQEQLQQHALNPTQALCELCSTCEWDTPQFTQVSYCSHKGYLYSVTVKDIVFFSISWSGNKNTAKELASAVCLKFLGFEFKTQL